MAYPFEPHLASIAEAAAFSPADLAANQRGYLSEGQIARLHRKSRRTWIMLSVWLFFMVILAVVVIFSNRRDRGEMHLIQALLGLSWISVLVYSLWDDSRRIGAARHAVTSEIILAGDPGEPLPCKDIIITINDHRFLIKQAAYRLLRPNQAYRFYYAPPLSNRSHLVLSIEPVEQQPIELGMMMHTMYTFWEALRTPFVRITQKIHK